VTAVSKPAPLLFFFRRLVSVPYLKCYRKLLLNKARTGSNLVPSYLSWTSLSKRWTKLDRQYGGALLIVALLLTAFPIVSALLQGRQTDGPQYFMALDKSYTEMIPHYHKVNRRGRRAIPRIGFGAWCCSQHRFRQPYNFAFP
jgi:hypothetical protein